MLQLHKNRQTLDSISALKIVNYEQLVSEWCFSSGIFLILYSERVAGIFETGAFVFTSTADQDKVTRIVQSAPETSRIRWNIYPLLTEFKMPESAVHAQADIEITSILRSTILNTLYMPGTSIVDSRLRSPASSCLYLQLNITDSLLGVLNGDTQKSPDFSLGFPEIERKRFLVGETGYSDTGDFTRRRITEWLTNGRGDVLHIHAEDDICFRFESAFRSIFNRAGTKCLTGRYWMMSWSMFFIWRFQLVVELKLRMCQNARTLFNSSVS